MRNILILIFLALLAAACIMHYGKNYSNVVIEFEKLPPIKQKIYVYYNGFKIGYTRKIAPCKTSNRVCIQAKISKKDMFLPDNITAKMKQKRIHDRKYMDYIEIVYPKNPSYSELGNSCTIKGELFSGFNNYMNEEIGYKEMEQIKQELINSVQNLEKITSILLDILNSLNTMAKASEKNVEGSAKNLNALMKNLNSAASKLDSSLDTKTIRSILQNMDDTSSNLNHSTDSLNGLTGSIRHSGLLNTAKCAARDICEITNGVKCTLKKPFGVLRLIFSQIIR